MGISASQIYKQKTGIKMKWDVRHGKQGRL